MVHFLQAIAVSRIMHVDMFPFKTPLARQKQVQKLTNIQILYHIIRNKKNMFRSFKSKENIHKKDSRWAIPKFLLLKTYIPVYSTSLD